MHLHTSRHMSVSKYACIYGQKFVEGYHQDRMETWYTYSVQTGQQLTILYLHMQQEAIWGQTLYRNNEVNKDIVSERSKVS